MRFSRSIGLGLLLAGLAFAVPAQAAEEFTNCTLDPMNAGATDLTPASGPIIITAGTLGLGRLSVLCWDFDENEALAVQSPQILVQAERVIVQVDAGDDSEDADTCQVDIRRLSVRTKPAVAADALNQSAKVGNTLTGLGGASGTQLAAERIGAGDYFLVIAAAGAAGDDCRVRFDIEKN